MKDKKHILLVEDDLNLGFVIQDTLKIEGYDVHLETNGVDGFKSFSQGDFDLCIFDVMMPKKDGFSLAEDVRKIDQNIPIFFLTAKSLTEDKIKGFNSGADDYLTKPFSQEEFLLRVQALLKRTAEKVGSPKEIKLGKVTFNPSALTLSWDGGEQKLTKRESEILSILCRNINELSERELILKSVWGDDSYFNGRSLDVFISKLRKYLKPDESIQIENIHGAGFKLVCN